MRPSIAAPTARARSQVCSNTSCVSRGINFLASSFAAGFFPTAGTSTTRSNKSSRPNASCSRWKVSSQRRCGLSRGRSGFNPSGRSSSTSWKPITCSTTALASQASQGDERSHFPSADLTASPNRRHTAKCSSPAHRIHPSHHARPCRADLRFHPESRRGQNRSAAKRPRRLRVCGGRTMRQCCYAKVSDSLTT
jgi:hypothetical protein